MLGQTLVSAVARIFSIDSSAGIFGSKYSSELNFENVMADAHFCGGQVDEYD